MASSSTGDMSALPEGCLAHILSFTTPVDVCNLSTVSPMFNNAALSDIVWETFLPTDYRSILSRSSDPTLLYGYSKKQLYISLCENPILIDDGRKSFSIDKRSGKKRFMLSARDLSNPWGNTPEYWIFTAYPDSRFAEVSELIRVCWLELIGRMNTNMLSAGTNYGVYLVFKILRRNYGLLQPAEAEVTLSVARIEQSRRSVYMNMAVERGDGWKEVELDEYLNADERDGELEIMFLKENPEWQRGLIVEGMEIRPKQGDN